MGGSAVAAARGPPRARPVRRSRHQRHVHRAGGQHGPAAGPADRRPRGRPRRRRPRRHPESRPALGPAQGGTPRQRHRVKPPLARCAAAAAGSHQQRPGQSLRPSRARDHRATRRRRRHGLAHRPARNPVGGARWPAADGGGAPGRPFALPALCSPRHPRAGGVDRSQRPLLRSTRWRYQPGPKRSHCSCRPRPRRVCCST